MADAMTRPDQAPKVITFDFWNTLIQEQSHIRDRRLDAWLGLLEGEATALERQHLHDAMDRSWGRFQDAWRANVRYDAFDAVRDVLEHIGLEPPADIIDQLVSVVTDPDPSWHPDPTPNIGDTLESIKSAGLRIGIICDVGLTPSRTLRHYLDHHGLLGYFDHWSFSDEVGTFKPDPVIFRHALEGLGGADPSTAAHVGDLRRTDIAGAQRMGIYAVRYTGVSDDSGSGDPEVAGIEGDAVLDDHGDLPGLLGLT